MRDCLALLGTCVCSKKVKTDLSNQCTSLLMLREGSFVHIKSLILNAIGDHLKAVGKLCILYSRKVLYKQLGVTVNSIKPPRCKMVV